MPPAAEWKKGVSGTDHWRLTDCWNEVLAVVFPTVITDTFKWQAPSVQCRGETWTEAEAKQEAEEALGIMEEMKVLDLDSLEAKVRRCWYPANPEPVLDVHDKASLAEQLERERERWKAMEDFHLLLGGPRHLDVLPICGACITVPVILPTRHLYVANSADRYDTPIQHLRYVRSLYERRVDGRSLGKLRLGILEGTTSEKATAMLTEAGVTAIIHAMLER
ncbi:hypothetical protein UFOVP783_3 [uncultured Caudovirales phage]|uniref:Uncharacterized protein n=1 Tax=uncultured Caudovirales phage TaxID=2100421 RepID=A0A6J5NXX0_9CAUD|nr:hypothetical protein UFOVP783_3 [uncultured Caudovirales phage]